MRLLSASPKSPTQCAKCPHCQGTTWALPGHYLRVPWSALLCRDRISALLLGATASLRQKIAFHWYSHSFSALPLKYATTLPLGGTPRPIRLLPSLHAPAD